MAAAHGSHRGAASRDDPLCMVIMRCQGHNALGPFGEPASGLHCGSHGTGVGGRGSELGWRDMPNGPAFRRPFAPTADTSISNAQTGCSRLRNEMNGNSRHCCL